MCELLKRQVVKRGILLLRTLLLLRIHRPLLLVHEEQHTFHRHRKDVLTHNRRRHDPPLGLQRLMLLRIELHDDRPLFEIHLRNARRTAHKHRNLGVKHAHHQPVEPPLVLPHSIRLFAVIPQILLDTTLFHQLYLTPVRAPVVPAQATHQVLNRIPHLVAPPLWRHKHHTLKVRRAFTHPCRHPLEVHKCLLTWHVTRKPERALEIAGPLNFDTCVCNASGGNEYEPRAVVCLYNPVLRMR